VAKSSPERGRFIPYNPESEPEIIDGEIESSDEEKAFDDFRNNLSAGEEMATLRVSRIPKSASGNPMTARLAYCFSCPIDRYTFEELCEFVSENYGGGLYRLIGTRKGHRGTAFNKLLDIAEPIPKKLGEGESRSPNVSAIMESVSTMIIQMQERTEAMLARVNNPAGAAGGVDPFAMMERVVGMLGSMGMIGAKAPGGDLLGELQKLAQIKNLLGEFGEGGRSDSESNFYDLASQGLKPIAPLLPTLAARLPAPSAPANSPTLANRPVPESNQAASAAEPQNVNLKNQVDLLVANAAAGITPDAMANMIIDATPDEKVDALRAFIAQASVVDQMAQVNPAVTQHREFFDALRVALMRELTEPKPGLDPRPDAHS